MVAITDSNNKILYTTDIVSAIRMMRGKKINDLIPERGPEDAYIAPPDNYVLCPLTDADITRAEIAHCMI